MTPATNGGRSSDLAAIVLAGGGSRRFGRDKLVEMVDGVRMLDRTTDAVRSLAAEIVVVVGSTGGPDAPPGVILVRDTEPDAGPLAGLAAGLAVVRANRILVVAGDMPFLEEAILAMLLAGLADPAVVAVALVHDGRPRP